MSEEAMDRALDRLETALVGKGLPGLEPASDVDVLAEIDDALAPLALPPDLRRFWTRIDPSSLGSLGLFPIMVSPYFALETYRGLLAWEQPQLFGPPLLLPVAYSSHCFRSVELTSPWHHGGSVFYWVNNSTEGFRLQYRSLTDLIVAVSELVEAEAFEHRGEHGGQPLVSIDGEAEEHKQAVGLLIAGSDPTYGDAVLVGNDLASWPPHWLAAAGVDPADRSPRGPTHTIAAALAEAAKGTLRARIVGTVIRLVGTGDGMRVVVEDGTGLIDVACRRGTSPWSPALRQTFEFEITLTRSPGPLPEYDRWHTEIQTHALNARHEQAVAATAELERQMSERPAQAIATDIRPITAGL